MSEREPFVRTTRAPDPAVPAGAWDCQLHIYGDPARFPPRRQSAYSPLKAWFDDAHLKSKALGMSHVSIVQATSYGIDHSLLLDALGRCRDGVYDGIRYHGVAIVNDSLSDLDLRHLHEAGVRAARFNFWKRLNVAPTLPEFRRSLARIAELGWHARVHATAVELLELGDELAATPGTLVLDHMGHLKCAEGLDQPARKVIKELLARDNWWIMLSSGERDSATDFPWDDAVPFGQSYYALAPERCVWATDWPHAEYPKTPINDADLVELLYRYLPDREAVHRVLVDNPARLHGLT
ncbi:MAG: amidohydrolase [Burkholderiaceae bacterium]